MLADSISRAQSRAGNEKRWEAVGGGCVSKPYPRTKGEEEEEEEEKIDISFIHSILPSFFSIYLSPILFPPTGFGSCIYHNGWANLFFYSQRNGEERRRNNNNNDDDNTGEREREREQQLMRFLWPWRRSMLQDF